MYCSKRECYNDVCLEEDNYLEYCQKHYDEFKAKLKQSKTHTMENCFCGMDHSKVSEKIEEKS